MGLHPKTPGSHLSQRHPLNQSHSGAPLTLLCFCGFFFKILFICSRETQRERERHRHRQRKKQAPGREPDAGHDSRSPGSRPEPKADAQRPNHPRPPARKSLLKSNSKYSFIPMNGHITHSRFPLAELLHQTNPSQRVCFSRSCRWQWQCSQEQSCPALAARKCGWCRNAHRRSAAVGARRSHLPWA